MSIRRITCATLCTTDGVVTHYGIFRANLHFALAGREPYIDLNHKAVRIGTVTKNKNSGDRSWHNEELTQRYLEMAEPFATPDVPAFAFTDCIFCHGTDPECHCMRRTPNISLETESDSSLAAGETRTDLRQNGA